ncbi:hypothetical protein [Streptosporangium sp. CA-115845]|uniref:hypothetical protein n=1 Tax=Streptosporangium sp. CA-115845 TaxID=3240071 RepID=UPI003D90849B
MTITLPGPDLSLNSAEASCRVGDPGLLCGRDVVITLVVGCVHEHLLRRPLCQFHVERLANGRVICGHCFDADGHRCELHLLREIPASIP